MEFKIESEVIDNATNAAITKMLSEDNYSNPVKKILEDQFSWDMQGNGKTEIAKQFKAKVEDTIAKLLDSPDFHALLGERIASKFAEAAVKDLRNLKDLNRR